jgi:hypothetical protein
MICPYCNEELIVIPYNDKRFLHYTDIEQSECLGCKKVFIYGTLPTLSGDFTITDVENKKEFKLIQRKKPRHGKIWEELNA